MTARSPPAALRRFSLDLGVVGHANLDFLLRVRDLPQKDRTVPVDARELRLGGTAVNIARAASHWGVRAGLISRVGPDFPAEFLRAMEAEHIDLDGVERSGRVPSSACFIAEDGAGGQTTLIDQGPMRDDAPVRLAAGLFGRAPWYHLTTGAPEYLFRAKSLARRHGARVAVDPAQEVHYRWDRPGLVRLLDGSEALFGNEHEVDRVAEILGAGRWTELVDRVPLVVRTRGAAGAEAVSRSGRVAVPAPRLGRLRQVTGAGDAFRGGFYAGFFAGQPLRGCLAAGVRSARWWMRSRGIVLRAGTVAR